MLHSITLPRSPSPSLLRPPKPLKNLNETVHIAPVLPVATAAVLGLVALLYMQRTLDLQKNKKKEVEMGNVERPGSGDRMLMRVDSEA